MNINSLAFSPPKTTRQLPYMTVILNVFVTVFDIITGEFLLDILHGVSKNIHILQASFFIFWVSQGEYCLKTETELASETLYLFIYFFFLKIGCYPKKIFP